MKLSRSHIYVLLISSFILFHNRTKAQIDPEREYYHQAYSYLDSMLNDQVPYSFKKAVFTVENAYYDNVVEQVMFNKYITTLSKLSKLIAENCSLIYQEKDSTRFSIYAGIFSMMMDTTRIIFNDDTVKHHPCSYDFDDPFGHKDWSKMFVTKLLKTKKGNCHSLPLLYKIIAEELNQPVYLALAPNHVYIKLKSEKLGWYNTELTSGDFPRDAWMMASGFVHLDAIVNKLYMQALNDKQSLALCLLDLAKGYEKKFGSSDGKFIIKCCQTALKHYPNYINAMLMMGETKLKLKMYRAKIAEEKIQNLEEIQALYDKMDGLGYREIVDDKEKKYLKWLSTVKEYQNTEINKLHKN